jgi:hypothetical protein
MHSALRLLLVVILVVAPGVSWSAIITAGDGAVYQGEMQDGSRHGRGVSQYPDGSWYDGGYRQDKRHGSGVLRGATGDYYAGGFADDLYQGQGTLLTADGMRYSGGFQAGLFHGEGILTFPNNSFYVGIFRQGKKHGVFHFIPTDREGADDPYMYDLEVQVGVFENDVLTDSWQSPDKLVYKGEWSGRERHGQGALYQSPVVLDHWNYAPNQLICQGTFSHGRAPEDCVLRDRWEARYPVGRLEKTFPDGSRFVGEVRELPDDYRNVLAGAFTFADGSVYQGSMVIDESEGRAVYGPVPVTLPSGKTGVRLLEAGFPALLDEEGHARAATIFTAAEEHLQRKEYAEPKQNCALEKADKLVALGALGAAAHIQTRIIEGYVALSQEYAEKGDKKESQAFMDKAKDVARLARIVTWDIQWSEEEWESLDFRYTPY